MSKISWPNAASRCPTKRSGCGASRSVQHSLAGSGVDRADWAKNVRGVVVNRPRARFKVEKFGVTVWYERREAMHNAGRRNDGNIETGERLVRNGNPVTHGFLTNKIASRTDRPAQCNPVARFVAAFPGSPALVRCRVPFGSSSWNPPPYTRPSCRCGIRTASTGTLFILRTPPWSTGTWRRFVVI